MIIMSGRCLHGGSTYPKCNARLHLEFMPHQESFTNVSTNAHNVVGIRYRCPLEICPHRSDRKSFNRKKDLYNHWQNAHLKTKQVNISLKKYIHVQNGGLLETCNSCGKGFKSKSLLARHERHCV
jgi:hypothetical protein